MTNKETITINRKMLKIYSTLIAAIVMIISGYYFFFYNGSFSIISTVQPQTIETLGAKFAVLSQAKTNACGGGKTYINQLSVDGTKIQGSCCSAMDFHRYVEQIEGLEKYSKYDLIPKNPYDVPSQWADEMIEYAENTILTYEQQSIYDEAVSLSHEGGPCCCKCWHWYAYEGLAEKLIIEYDFTAEQIAEVWDLSDACGGSGHIEGGGGH